MRTIISKFFFNLIVLNHGFPHPTILLHGIGAGDLEIDLSDQKKTRMDEQEGRSRFLRPKEKKDERAGDMKCK